MSQARASLHVFQLFCLSLTLLAACGTGAPETRELADRASRSSAEGPAVAEALKLFQTQDFAGAAGILERILEREGDSGRLWFLLGSARKSQKELDRALTAFARALEVDPTQYGATYNTAAIHALEGRPDEAFELLSALRDSGTYDLSQITLDGDLENLRDDERFQALLMKPEEFANPFVEEARILHEWVGEAEGDAFGWIARNLGDVDGDGIADVVTSAPTKNIEGERAGKVYVYSGQSGDLLWQQPGEFGDRLGEGVEAAGDVNADGVPDVIAGAPGDGEVRLYSGRDGELILTLTASQEGERFGRDVLGVGDADGDGHDDVLVGAPRNDQAGDDAGRAAVYSGRDGSILAEWLGEEPGDRLGEAVAGQVGERSFYILGAPDAGDGDRGRVYVYGGLEGEPEFIVDSDEEGSELGGMFLSVVGDVDADGVLDVYASDWSHGAAGSTSGQIVVHSGADGSELLKIAGQAAGDGFGIGPADAGDVDGDGHADLVVGAWQHTGGAPGGGKVYLYSGKDGSLLRAWTCRVMGDTFGFDATGMGDVDGDGKIDFLLTSAWSAVRGPRSGRMFILAGG